MSEKSQKPEKKIVLKDRPQQATSSSPLLWLALLAVPLLLGLLVGLSKDINEPPPEPPRKAPQSITARPAEPQLRPQTFGRGGGGMRPVANPVLDAAIATVKDAQPKTYSCNFEPWVGRKLSQDMLDALKGASGDERPYRILRPGSMMTQDHSPARVNFETDQAGTITRIWCG